MDRRDRHMKTASKLTPKAKEMLALGRDSKPRAKVIHESREGGDLQVQGFCARNRSFHKI